MKKKGRLQQTLHGMKRISKFKKYKNSEVLHGSHEDKEESTITLRLILEKILVSKSYGIYVEGLVFIASLSSTLGYIVTTYSGKDYMWYEITDLFICGLFALEYLLFFYISQQKLQYFLNAETLIDLYIFSSIFLFNMITWDMGSLLISISRLLRVTKIAKILKKWLQIGDNNVNSQIFTIAITIFTIIYVFAGILQLLENKFNETDLHYEFHHMVYFIVVTFSTVGYGDIVPSTTVGEMAVMIVIVMVIVLIPKQSSDLLMLIDLQSPYARAKYKSNPEIPHLIICGNASVLALKNFCNELLHPDHGAQDKNAVILDENVPNAEMEMLLRDPQYEVYLSYLQGNPMIDKDLERASANKSKLCVIFTDKNTRDPIAADHKNILTALAIKQQVYYEVQDMSMRVCVQILKPESQTHYFSTSNIQSAEPRDHLIIVEEIKMNLMAKSCFSPGIIGLVSNLVATSGDLEGLNETWINEYIEGMNFELYRTEVPPIFKGKTFLEIVKIIYFQLKAIVIGWERTEGNRPVVTLNPGNTELFDTKKTKMYLYLMCKDKDTADKVADIKYTPDYPDTNSKAVTNVYNQKLGKYCPDEEEKEDAETYFFEEPSISDKDIEEQLTNDRFYLDNGEGTCEIKDTIQDFKEITNHIVVCGMHSSMRYFLNTMRAKYLKQCPYIVILSTRTLPHDEWEAISKFAKIIYIQGSPLVEEDLLRANVHRASRAVVLEIDQRENEENTDEMRDAQTIFIYKALKKCNPNLQATCALSRVPKNKNLMSFSTQHHSNSNITYLLPKSLMRENDRYDLSPIFASGEVYISTLIDVLSCQAYYNPHIIGIIHQILTGGSLSKDQKEQQSNLWQIIVPEEYVNEPFKELFVHLLMDKHLVVLGLYRLPGATDNDYAYVYTNPDPDCILTSKDRVFVIGSQVSPDMLVSLDLLMTEETRPHTLMRESSISDSRSDNAPASSPRAETFMEKHKEIQKSPARTENVLSTELTQVIKKLNEKLEHIEDQIKDIKTKFGVHADEIKRTVQTSIMQKLKSLQNI